MKEQEIEIIRTLVRTHDKSTSQPTNPRFFFFPQLKTNQTANITYRDNNHWDGNQTILPVEEEKSIGSDISIAEIVVGILEGSPNLVKFYRMNTDHV